MHARKTNEAKNLEDVYEMLFAQFQPNQGINTKILQGLLPR